MCRSIKTLRTKGDPAGSDEIKAAALQFVRKISGYHTPSRANEQAFETAVDDIAEVAERFLHSLKYGARA